jgi:hypothetical protein
MIGVGGTKRGQHVLICESVLGRPLAKGVQVHHVNNIPDDNRHENLVICPDVAYHKLLHIRTAAYDACGHADWHKCQHCKEYGDTSEVIAKMRGGKAVKWFHRSCERLWWRQYYSKRQAGAA